MQDKEHAGEAPLVLFTVCVPAAVGVAGCALALGGPLPLAALAFLLASAGMAGSVFHLARPLRAPGSLRGLQRSALSQEIGAVIVFWVLLALWLAAEYAQPLAAQTAAALAAPTGQEQAALPLWATLPWGAVSLGARVVALLWGAVLLWVINRAYRVETRPAWDGPEGLMELVGIACGCGGALYALASCALAVAAGTWGEGGVGAVAPLGAAVPAVAALLAVAAAVLHASAHARRAARMEALVFDAGGAQLERARLGLERLAELEPRALFSLSLCTAAAALELSELALAFAPTFSWPLLLSWALLAALQLVCSVLQRTRFYQLPVLVSNIAPLRK